MRKEKPTMAMYASAGLPGLTAWLPDPTKPFIPIVNFEGMQPASLVPLVNCPNVPGPCGYCAYCRARTDGPEWWLQNG